MRLKSKVQSPKSTHGALHVPYSVLRVTFRNPVPGSRFPVPRLPLSPFSFEPSAFSQRGFTLLEILVASAILSLVLATLYGVFSQTLSVKRQVEQRTTLSRTARVVLQRIADDVQASFSLSPENARFRGDTQPTSVFPHSSFSFLSFASTHLTDSGREGGWSEISYALVPDPSDAELWQLVRWAHFDPSEPQTQDSETDNSEAIPLLTGVQGFRVRFFDGRTWREEWNQEKTPGRLPQAIEIELVVAVAERRERTYGAAREVATFSTLVDVPLASTAVRRTAPRRES